MMSDRRFDELIDYGIRRQLLREDDRVWAYNQILMILQADSDDAIREPEGKAESRCESEADSDALSGLLDRLCEAGLNTGALQDGGVVSRDLFDTKLMGVLTPRPSEVRTEFARRYAVSPETATDWFYAFSQDTNYIRRDRIRRDMRWKVSTEYGELDITINLSKPEKDPRAIAAAKQLPQSAYPRCQLCLENEGYAGRLDHPARENHRIIPLQLDGNRWYFQYSPYVYYNEHCIVFNAQHVPMKIDGGTFRRLLDFVGQFPHYFVGSNADLPIVGGSILSHDHFQGGHYTFAMEKAPVETPLELRDFPNVKAGIVKWPLSVIRLSSADAETLAQAAERILDAWRGYTDEDAFIFAETDGVPHNTITPIARRRGEAFELDLVLRNNITTEEHPLGVYHPHAELHHIKKENIGLIEVMGLAVLPSRLKEEMRQLAGVLAAGGDLRADESIAHHADWAESLREKYVFDRGNVDEILRQEIGRVFLQVLEHAGVYRRTPEGKEAFLRFCRTAGLCLPDEGAEPVSATARQDAPGTTDRLRHLLAAGALDERIREVYMTEDVSRHLARVQRVLDLYDAQFGQEAASGDMALFSAPGRTELGGNHTDHQRGCVLAASVSLDLLSAAAPNGTDTVRLASEGYGVLEVDLSDLSVHPEEQNRTEALIRGIAAAVREKGFRPGGFTAAVISDVPGGSGLSSSAAFETLIGVIFNRLFCRDSLDAVEIAKVGQYAENVYFGKPCGLMDQMACSVGGAIAIDFVNPEMPQVTRIPFSFRDSGYRLCIIDTGADHADLTEDYAAIPAEMKRVARAFGKEVLREVPEEQFLRELQSLRKSCGSRAVLRASHFYKENARVRTETEALLNNDFQAFLRASEQSGRSSFMYLQNVFSPRFPDQQAVAVALMSAEHILGGRGICRVHGGGFAGTIQAFVPEEMAEEFRRKMEAVLGEGCCMFLQIRPYGGIVLA